ncbi:MAG: hypothetical protein JXA07_07345 [Spirochaetes bacterium]|nr:hypothetical protein [Spirochaetota bacterium]
MKRHAIHCVAVTLSILAFSILSCSDSENRHLAQLGQAKVIIDLNLPEEHASTGILDRLRSLFVRDAIAQSAPATFGLIRVRVSGAGIGVIDREFAPYDVITMNVPAGDFRYFEVTAYVAPGDPSAAASFRGTAVASLKPGATVSLPVVMNVDEMRLVVPDYSGQKIVMMDGINGGNVRSRLENELFDTPETILYELRPYDIDFDAQQRIYFANLAFSTGTGGGIIRMDNIDSRVSTGTCILFLEVFDGVRSIAIDRKRNKIYYSNFSDINRVDIDGGTPEPVVSATNTVRAICVNEATGYIYYTYISSLDSSSWIVAYNPNTEFPGEINSYNCGNTNTYDLIVKGGYLYASYYSTTRIVRLSLDLLSTPEPLLGKPDESDSFIGPREFIAVTNRKLYVIDEFDGNGNEDERIVSFADITGSGWDTYPEPPQSLFTFYSSC